MPPATQHISAVSDGRERNVFPGGWRVVLNERSAVGPYFLGPGGVTVPLGEVPDAVREAYERHSQEGGFDPLHATSPESSRKCNRKKLLASQNHRDFRPWDVAGQDFVGRNSHSPQRNCAARVIMQPVASSAVIASNNVPPPPAGQPPLAATDAGAPIGVNSLIGTSTSRAAYVALPSAALQEGRTNCRIQPGVSEIQKRAIEAAFVRQHLRESHDGSISNEVSKKAEFDPLETSRNRLGGTSRPRLLPETLLSASHAQFSGNDGPISPSPRRNAKNQPALPTQRFSGTSTYRDKYHRLSDSPMKHHSALSPNSARSRKISTPPSNDNSQVKTTRERGGGAALFMSAATENARKALSTPPSTYMSSFGSNPGGGMAPEGDKATLSINRNHHSSRTVTSLGDVQAHASKQPLAASTVQLPFPGRRFNPEGRCAEVKSGTFESQSRVTFSGGAGLPLDAESLRMRSHAVDETIRHRTRDIQVPLAYDD